jgi:hypothetical protein
MVDIQISYVVYYRHALPDFVQTVFAIGHDLPKSGLVPANIGFDGVVYVGAKGDLHFQSQKSILKVRRFKVLDL